MSPGHGMVMNLLQLWLNAQDVTLEHFSIDETGIHEAYEKRLIAND